MLNYVFPDLIDLRCNKLSINNTFNNFRWEYEKISLLLMNNMTTEVLLSLKFGSLGKS
jgi:hypothetical protein